MKVKTHQQVAGVPASTETEVDDDYGKWLVGYGYAVAVAEQRPQQPAEKKSEGRRRKE